LFFEEAPANFHAMKRAQETGDTKTTEQLAHKLKGGCMNLGAKKLGSLFESVEKLAREDSKSISGSLLAEINQEFERTIEFLREYVAKT